MPRGRPSKYKPEFCKSLVDFFNIPPYYFKTKRKKNNQGKYESTKEKIVNDVPFFLNWCMKIGISQETMLTWTSVYPDFLEAYKKAKELQKQIIITNAMRGNYEQAFSIFTMKNISDWRDAKEDKRDQQPVQVFIQNIIHKAGVSDAERQAGQGHLQGAGRLN